VTGIDLQTEQGFVEGSESNWTVLTSHGLLGQGGDGISQRGNSMRVTLGVRRRKCVATTMGETLYRNRASGDACGVIGCADLSL
jgi:hypothetical protein